MSKPITLDDKYLATEGSVYLTGSQALVRLPMTQMRRDRAAGLNTGTFISGYRGSPLGGIDQQFLKARKFLDPLDIVFQPGVNEDLAATAVWGSQQLHLSPGARKDGVLGIWYGKGPGVDRSGDAFKHANAAGTARHGGVLAIAGDDHTCKSSTIPHQSDHAFIGALMPVLYPSSVHEFLELGLLGVAMSRYSGCWVGFKVISETVETTSVVDLAQEQTRFVLPDDFELPEGGLNLRWPDPPLIQDERLQEHKGYAAIAFARANQVNRVEIDTPKARFGIVASGRAYDDVRQALAELGLGHTEWEAIGLRFYKVRMPWPLEPQGIRAFSEGLEEVLIIEERREIIENQIKEQLFNWRADVRPRIIGKFDEHDRPFLSLSAGLTVSIVAGAIAERVLKLDLPGDLADRIRARLGKIRAAQAKVADYAAPVIRMPHYCAGCPHNTSTRVVEGSKAMAGIGCHYMVQWMDRNTETFTQMGGEGVPWTAIAPFTDEKHRFVNLGDGTYFHSGYLAVRQSVAAKANITYKILYNDAVAMTGGQAVDGELSPEQITHQMYREGAARIVLMSDAPQSYLAGDLAPGTKVRHRDEIDVVMRELREVPGVTVLLYVQTCAAEKRRRRKRGLMEDPDLRVWINPSVCEGCGDCSVQSNCIAVEPLETEMGRKRRINQSMCNKDFSCLKGFCPSFVSLRGATLKQRAARTPPDISALPEPSLPVIERAWNIAVTGVGGTGVLTIGAILGMAAHIDGKIPMILDMAGLAQKGGAVLSHVRISAPGRPIAAPKIAAGGADLLLAADSVVAASRDSVVLCDKDRTHSVFNAHVTPVSDFIRQRDFDFREAGIEARVRETVREGGHFHNFTAAASSICGDEIAANMMMLGYAWQKGFVPLGHAAIVQAIELNGVAVSFNLAAFDWGRLFAHDPAKVLGLIEREEGPRSLESMTAQDVIAHRRAHLVAYQDEALAERYEARLTRLSARLDLTRAADEALLRLAAINLARVLAYKDEYEVARLYTDPDFQERLRAQFDGDLRLVFHFAPPFLPGRDAQGRPKKRAFGAWILPVLRQIAQMKHLRGSSWDPFGFSADRKLERRLIDLYEDDLSLAEQVLADAQIGQEKRRSVGELLDLPAQIRGYGPVKQASFDAAMARRERLRAALLSDEPVRSLAAE
ncbi:MAG: indolepyruvate ferredoxin oxidoreductase family protein [Neomegalonema sp.]|nr:indolepyruvate ferredoxin oxidoreductase family protein [Neomegalonema sp.]